MERRCDMKYENEKHSKKMSLTIKPSNYNKMKVLADEGKIKSMSDFVNFLVEDYFKKNSS